jgi:D-methionine transport system substrate-binding protein
MHLIKCCLLAFFCTLGLSACQPSDSSNTLTVGTIAGPETDLVKTAKTIAKDEYDLNIRIVEFNDYNLPNEDLQDGSLDANVYQHLPYLLSAQKAHGYTLEPIARTFLFPAGLYSKKIKNIQDLPEKAQIAIPNDPSNEARALLLLAQSNLITLKQTDTPSVQDIEKNPKKLRFKTLDAAQLPRILPDVDAAIINTTFAIPAGLNPMLDALIRENKNSPYANLIVIKTNTPKREQLDLFVKAMHSDAIKNKAHELFGDAAIPAW